MELVSYEDLAADANLNPNGTGYKLAAGPNDYAMVVVDEAQNLRNPSTQRAEALRRLLQGSPPKQLVLLSATPVNNSLWDLYYVLNYFLHNDAAFADVGIRSLRDHFAAAMAQNPDDLSPEHLFDILDAVAVRAHPVFREAVLPRTTPSASPGASSGSCSPHRGSAESSTTSTPSCPASLTASRKHSTPTPGQGTPDVLSLARYAPSQYRRDDAVDTYETQLAGLLRSGMLKRFESSPTRSR